jgi:CheY-like chemotaxis protein
MKILVIEGYYMCRDAISGVLGLGRHDLIFAQDGEAALKLLADSHDFDLLITANRTHGMYGIDVLRIMRTDNRYLSLPAIMFSSDDNPDLIREAIELSAAFVAKTEGAHEIIKAALERFGLEL